MYVIIGGNGDSIYTRLMRAVGSPHMDGTVPGYRTNGERMQNEAAIMETLAQWVHAHSSGALPARHYRRLS